MVQWDCSGWLGQCVAAGPRSSPPQSRPAPSYAPRIIFDILGHRNEWWVPGKIVEARQRLAHYWKVGGLRTALCLCALLSPFEH